MYISGVSLSLCAGGQWGFQLGICSFSYERKYEEKTKRARQIYG